MAVVTSLSVMQIGDIISCEYTASSNTFGTFGNLGSATKDLIPVTSSATPDGKFYFIHTGYDHLGRMKLVADRNIQRNISWDKLNEAGLCGESTVSIDNKDFSMRLLSGGVSATNKDNEWDKIIAEYDLDATITAGDNNIWNWSGIGSWTSSTPTTGNTYRAIRGNSSIVARTDNQASSAVATTIGFRPVLLVPTGLYLTVVSFTDKTYNQDIDIIGSIEFIDEEVSNIRYRYLVNGVAQSWSSFGIYTTLNISVPYSLLEYGVNEIKIEAETVEGETSSVSINVTRVITELLQPQAVYFNKVTLSWLPILSPEKLDFLQLKRIDRRTDASLILIADEIIKDITDNYPTFTINLGVSKSIDQYKVNKNSIYFNGTSTGTIQLPPNEVLNFGLGDFTIGFWFKWESRVSTYPQIFCGTNSYDGINIGDYNTSKAAYVIGTSAERIYSTSDVTDGAWHYYAICRKEGVFYLSIDGRVEVINSSYTSVVQDYSVRTMIGGEPWSGNRFKGWIDEFTVVKGKALYTEDFTPPIASIQQVTGDLYEDTDLLLNTSYSYKLIAIVGSTEIEINVISIITPIEAYLYHVWQDGEYISKVIEGISFDSAEVDYDFYTTPNKVIIKPLVLGDLIGGRIGNVFAFEVLNTYEDKDFTITLYATDANQNMAIPIDNYGEFQDSDNPDWRSCVAFDYTSEFTSEFTVGGFYPAIFELTAGQKKVIYSRFKPGVDAGIGQKVMYVIATTREVDFDE